jgi:hypothetical protein
MRRTLSSHIRANAIAYLALFVALGGTGYAATQLPAGSVGASQIKNHVIEAVKLNPNYIDGNVRVWASVSASGKVLAGGAGVSIIRNDAGPGIYIINPQKGSKLVVPRSCAPIASIDDHSGVAGYAEPELAVLPRGEAERWQVNIATYNAQGGRAALPFDFAVIC